MKKNLYILGSLVLLLILVGCISVLSSGSHMQNRASNVSSLPPFDQTEINAIGLANFIKKHSSEPHYEDFMYDIVFPWIASGDTTWIHNGYEIFQGRIHAGPSIGETIDQPLAQALIKNPTGVLGLFLEDKAQIFGVDRLCGSTEWNFNDSGDPRVDQFMMKDLIDQKNAVNTVKDPSLQILKVDCLKAIGHQIDLLAKKSI